MNKSRMKLNNSADLKRFLETLKVYKQLVRSSLLNTSHKEYISIWKIKQQSFTSWDLQKLHSFTAENKLTKQSCRLTKNIVDK